MAANKKNKSKNKSNKKSSAEKSSKKDSSSKEDIAEVSTSVPDTSSSLSPTKTATSALTTTIRTLLTGSSEKDKDKGKGKADASTANGDSNNKTTEASNCINKTKTIGASIEKGNTITSTKANHKNSNTKEASPFIYQDDLTAGEEYVTFVSSDQKKFKVPLAAAEKSGLVKNFLQDFGDLQEKAETPMEIPFPNIDAGTLGRVITYLKYHKNETEVFDRTKWNTQRPADVDMYSTINRTTDIIQWDYDFIAELNQEQFLSMFKAANYMEIDFLLHLCCQMLANVVRGKSAQEIRDIFNIPNTFTEEQKREIHCENNLLPYP